MSTSSHSRIPHYVVFCDNIESMEDCGVGKKWPAMESVNCEEDWSCSIHVSLFLCLLGAINFFRIALHT